MYLWSRQNLGNLTGVRRYAKAKLIPTSGQKCLETPMDSLFVIEKTYSTKDVQIITMNPVPVRIAYW
jgi:hypothetical protein